MKKIFIFLYKMVLKLLLLFLIITRFMYQNYNLAILYSIILLLFTFSYFLKKKYFKYIFFLENLSYLFIFVYEFNCLYKNIPYWDTAMHGLTGFLGSVFIFLTFLYIKRKKKINLLYHHLITFMAFCFSLTIGVLFEIMEYSFDKLGNKDMQKDMFVDSIYTTKYDPLEKKLLKIEDIKETIIYYGDDLKEFKIQDGYLDIGINDTMKDLDVNLIGSILGSCYVFIILSKKDI